MVPEITSSIKSCTRLHLPGTKLNEAERTSVVVKLPLRIVDWIAHEARRKQSTSESILEEIVTRTVDKELEPLHDRLRRVNQLIKQIIEGGVETLRLEVQEAERATGKVMIASNLPPSFDERKKRRDHLLELGMEAYEELKQISSSEQASREAGYRLQAYQVMARVGMFNEAIIRDQEAEELAQAIEALEEGNCRLEESMKEIENELGIGKKRKSEDEAD